MNEWCEVYFCDKDFQIVNHTHIRLEPCSSKSLISAGLMNSQQENLHDQPARTRVMSDKSVVVYLFLHIQQSELHLTMWESFVT